jgi:general secretion pathway protein D
MRRLVRLAGLLLALTACLPAMADQAGAAFKHGTEAEARQEWTKAYELYKQAYDAKPENIKYHAAFVRIRFYASSELVHQGLKLRDAGKLDESLPLFQRAVEVDPTNFYAAQELKRTQQMMQKAASPQASTSSGSISTLAQQAGGPVELRAISNTPITLRMTEDAKVVYTTIGKLAGLNVLFDPDYTSRRINIELNGVTLYQALEIVSLESKTFWRPVTTNTIFVAADTPAKRKELEQSVVKTFYLGNVSSPNDLQDAVNTVRQILDVSRIQQIASQNAIVIRGTPDQIAMAEKLLGDIDKAKPEVVIEVAVMQVSRDIIKNLGVSMPTSVSVALTPNGTSSSSNNGNNNNNNNNGSSGGSGTGLTLNKFANLTANDITISNLSATLTALFSDSNTKIIQKPSIRALDNQKATLKIGDRVPVATGSFQPGIGGVGINPLVNTQFQYIDVGVNIDITPRIHADREVTLKMTLEISAVTGQSSIGGISQPVIGQRRIEHEIRLRDGEMNILGGILEDVDTQSLSGYPYISKIPILRTLFGQTNKERRENEIVFALIPHIVRGQDVTEFNTLGVDVGTASAIELRRMGPTPVSLPVPGQAQPNAPAQQPGPNQPAIPTPSPSSYTPPGQPEASAVPGTNGSLQAGNAVLSFEPAAVNQSANSTFVVNVSLSNAQNVYSVPAQISYDPKLLQLVNVSNGGFLGKDGQPVALVHRDDPTTGTLQVTATRPPGSGGVSGQGPVFTLTFMAKASGQANLLIKEAGARDPLMMKIPVAGGQAMVTVK